MGGDEIRGQAAVLRRAALYVALVVWTLACNGETTRSSCSFTLSPGSASPAPGGGTGSVTVSTPASCSWTATSDVDWVKVTSGSGGQGGGTVTYSVAPNTNASARSGSIKVEDATGQSGGELHQITQEGTTTPSPPLPLRGAYTFWMEADPGGTCGWPMTKFLWPVAVEVTSYVQGTTVGSIVFPAIPSTPSNKWSLHASSTGTQLVPGPGSPGPAAGAYDVVVDGGRWEAGGPTRAHDGRGEITSGTATGARLVLGLPGSDRRWECRSDVRWSLLIRYVDKD